jgi:hypothetical protein
MPFCRMAGARLTLLAGLCLLQLALGADQAAPKAAAPANSNIIPTAGVAPLYNGNGDVSATGEPEQLRHSTSEGLQI